MALLLPVSQEDAEPHRRSSLEAESKHGFSKEESKTFSESLSKTLAG